MNGALPVLTHEHFHRLGSSWDELFKIWESDMIVIRGVCMVVAVNVSTFGVVNLCSVVDVYQHFKGNCYVLSVPMMEAAHSSEMPLHIHQTTLCCLLEDDYVVIELHKILINHLSFTSTNILFRIRFQPYSATD
jgi:hypothetical protein